MKIFGFILKVFTYFIFTLILSQCIHCSHLKPPKNDIDIAQVYKIIYISNEFTPIEIKLIKESVIDWESSTGNFIRFKISTSFKGDYSSFLGDKNFYIVFLKCPTDSKKLVEVDEQIKKKEKEERIKEREKHKDIDKGKEEDSYSYALAFYDHSTIVPTINMVSDRIHTTDTFRQTVSHEIGHALGLDHNEDTNSIMYRSMDKASRHVTENDVENFCKIHLCKIEELKQNR